MNMASGEGYIIAEGPEGLRSVLESLYLKVQQDKALAIADHFILYQLGSQRSLIKVDFSKQPFQFWYNDLLGRPATKMVKDIIGDFLVATCGENVSSEGLGYDK